ncbi:MAG: hypothetical protein PHF25_00340 [Candidatus Margulisbacteria bacterium]|nr:hypothetical protein [Candidatus Margulisiibacteriota bacterium]
MLHTTLTQDKWDKYSNMQQILSIGAEFGRAKNAIKINDDKETSNSYLRALELLELTSGDIKWQKKLKELLYLKEYLAWVWMFARADIDICQKMYRTLLDISPETYLFKT